MPIYKAQISVETDTALPRDTMVITPHFNVSGASPTAGDLADDINAKMQTWLTVAPKIRTKLYVHGPPPQNPVADKVKNPAGTPIVSSHPRELALCLSYFQTFNRRGDRGRMYIPVSWINKATGGGESMGIRPSATMLSSVKLLATTLFVPIDAAGAQWGFWSDSDNTFKAVTDYWVDDEWDIVRKRGLRSTTRQTGVVP